MQTLRLWENSQNTLTLGIRNGDHMELDLIFRIAAVGIIVAVLNQILKKSDHD